ncbi:MAG: DNA repair protein RecO [Thermomicrobium sp.]|nr:DNA repair protein RecO [Thermomicrobium sp.]
MEVVGTVSEERHALQARRIRLFRTEAVVLRRRDLAEADRILTLLTRDFGKLRVVAKGVRRPLSRLGGHLDLFGRAQVLLARGRELDIVTQAQLIESFPGLRQEPWRAGWAGYLADLTDRATVDEDPQSALYDLLVDCLRALSSCDDPFAIVRRFEMRLLVLLGYRPELVFCPRCSRRLAPGPLAYAPEQGGVLCAECMGSGANEIPLSVGAVKALRLLLADQWRLVGARQLSPALREQIERALRAALAVQVGGPLPSAAVATLLERGDERDGRSAASGAEAGS